MYRANISVEFRHHLQHLQQFEQEVFFSIYKRPTSDALCTKDGILLSFVQDESFLAQRQLNTIIFEKKKILQSLYKVTREERGFNHDQFSQAIKVLPPIGLVWQISNNQRRKKKEMLQTKFNLGNSSLVVRSADYYTIESRCS